jgi:hypothetical protein
MLSFWLRCWSNRQSSPSRRRPARIPIQRRSRPTVEALEDRRLPSVFTVTNTADSGAGSLRQAILNANSNPGTNTIQFSIGTGHQRITPASVLPTITAPVILDAISQAGYAGVPLIELYGASAGASVTGLTITGGGSTVLGFFIDHFGGDGIDLTTNGGDTIQSNYIGTANGGNGLLVTSASNTIGGRLAGAGNVISGNTANGIDIGGTAATGNTVEGNDIGTQPGGALGLANGSNGVQIGSGASNNLISGNVLSGNGGEGIKLKDAGTSGNRVRGNLIGLNAAGAAALANARHGIEIINGAASNVVGPGNTISGNRLSGIYVNGPTTSNNVIQGNFIGTNPAGTVAFANGSQGHLTLDEQGIKVENAANDTIGGTTPGAVNVIAGNTGNGIFLAAGANGIVIQGNFIGTNASSAANLGNGGDGIRIDSSSSNTIGGAAAGAGNVISSNGGNGITLLAHAGSTPPFTPGSNDPSGLTLTSAGVAAGFTLSTFIDHVPPNPANGVIGPLGMVFPASGGFLASDQSGDVYQFAMDKDNQSVANAVKKTSYGAYNSAMMTLSGNRLYMTQSANRDVRVINADGTPGPILISGPSNPLDLVANPVNGHLYFSTGLSDQMYEINPLVSPATYTLFATNLPDPDGLSISPDGSTLYVAEDAGTSSRIVAYDTATRTLKTTFPATYVYAPDGITLGVGALAGYLFVSTNDGRVVELSAADPSIQQVIASGGSRGDFAKVDPSNDTVLLTQTDRIERLTLPIAGVASNNVIEGNVIGSVALPNAGDGIDLLGGAHNNTIGGTAAGAGNVISGNAGNGVYVSDNGTSGNAILANSIFGTATGHKGILLGNGGNDNQAAPVLTFASNAGGTTSVTGSLSGTADTSYILEFFASDSGSPSQGQTYLGQLTVTTDGTGQVSFTASLPVAVTPGEFATATATNTPTNDTSEFSSAVFVGQPPAFTSPPSATFTVGTAGSFTLTATAVPAPTLSESGGDVLPGGVTFNAATGVLSGTPAAGSGGAYTLHFTAHNGIGADATQTFTLTVNQAPAFTSPGSAVFATGTPGSFTVAASGYPVPTLSESGSDALPGGVSFDPTTAVLSGTPVAGSTGTYTLHFTATNGIGVDATQTFTLTVGQSPAFTSATSVTFTAGAAGSFAVSAMGIPAPTLSESGSDTLPDSVTFDPSTGVLSGTPAAGSGGTYTLHFTATNGAGSAAAQTFILTVNQAAAFTSATSAIFTVGTAGSFPVTASGFPVPMLSESGSDILPGGVAFNAAAGVLSGTPVTGSTGTYTLHFTARNGIGADATQTFALTVNQTPAFTNGNNTTFAVGAAGSFTVTASGSPTPTLSESSGDTLPGGVTFNAAMGILSGTPAAGSAGTYALHFTAHNGVGSDAAQTFTLIVDQAAAITSTNNTTFMVGTAATFTVTTSGFPVPVLSESPSDPLPGGLSFNAATGVLSGTPAAGSGGTYALHFTAHNGAGSDATQTFTLTVNQAAAFTGTNNATFTVGVAGGFTVTASGFPAPTLSESSSDPLPGGVSFNAATGVLSGTPAAGSGGTYALHFTAHNGAGSDATQTFTLTVNQPAAFTSATSAPFTVDVAGSFTVTASGFPAPTLSESGGDVLPGGVTFNAATGVLSGTPAVGSGGAYVLHFTATNGIGADDSQTFSLTVNEAPAFTSAGSAIFATGTPGSFTVAASGFPVPTLSESGSDPLPNGVTFDPSSSVLSGTPAAGSGGTYTLHFTATNGVGSDAAQTFTLTVNQAAAFTSATSAVFTVGTAGSFTVAASSFPVPMLGERGSDTLPDGVAFNSTTGVLSGTPLADSVGTYLLHFTAHNGIGVDASQTFTLTVDRAPAITSPSGATFTAGTAGTFPVAASGFPAPALTESPSDTLPSGVSFDSAAGVLSGTPAAGSGGTYTLHFTATNGIGADATQTFTLTVDELPPRPLPMSVRGIVARLIVVKVRKKKRFAVQVSFADTGAPQGQFLSPFQHPTFQGIRVSVRDSNGDGVPTRSFSRPGRARRS